MYRAYADGSIKDGISSVGYVIYKGKDVFLHKRVAVKNYNSSELEYIAVNELVKELNRLKLENVVIYSDSNGLVRNIKKSSAGIKVKYHMAINIFNELQKFSNRKLYFIRSFRNKAHKVCRGEFKYESPIIPEPALVIKPPILSVSEPKPIDIREEMRMVIKFRPHILMQCPTCKEHKAATEYPRYKTSNKRRNCNTCESNLNFLHSCTMK